MKRFTLFYFAFLLNSVFLLAQEWNQLGANIGSEENPMSNTTVNGAGDIMAYSLDYPKTSTIEKGLVRVAQFDGENWNQIGQDIIYGTMTSINYSRSALLNLSLSDDGKTLAIGAPYESSVGNFFGEVTIFKFDGNSWVQQGSTIHGKEQSNFGSAVKLSKNGNRLVIGGNYTQVGAGGFAGVVRVYEFNNSDWTQLGQDLYNDKAFGNGNSFGYDVDINDEGNIIAASHNAGAALIYQLDGSTWLEVAKFNDAAYYYISLNGKGDRIAIGAPTDPNNNNVMYAGLTKVYTNTNGDWTQTGETFYGTAMFGWFGRTRLNSEGNILAIGSEGISSLFGNVMVYKLIADDWKQIGATINDDVKGSFFGNTVDLNNEGSIIVIGSRDGAGSQTIHLAKVFEFSCNDDVPVVDEVPTFCANNSIELTASASEGSTINWYENENSTTPIFVGNTFETPILSESRSYWVESVSEIECVSSRKEVVVNVLPLPELILEETEINVCSGSVASLYAESPNHVIFWYANENDTEYLYHGNLFVTPELTADKTYWVEAYNLTTGCRSERIQVIVTISEKPAAPIANATQYFEEGKTLADLEVEHTLDLAWFADEYLTVSLPETTVLVLGRTYYVAQKVNDCLSDAVAITIDRNLSSTDFANQKTKYYPNPVINDFTIESKNIINQVQIYDLTGRLVLDQKVNSQKVKLNLSQLTNGTYIVKILGTDESESIKIIKK